MKVTKEQRFKLTRSERKILETTQRDVVPYALTDEVLDLVRARVRTRLEEARENTAPLSQFGNDGAKLMAFSHGFVERSTEKHLHALEVVIPQERDRLMTIHFGAPAVNSLVNIDTPEVSQIL